ncbi:hypothetical protein NCAS_0B02970 [Naumovozyma castellii]|uniref:DASH complex subunit SPC19 n=1 Tax=Naumovozyma castellii TaxID=27288 RepID=G0VBQ5_NAUCA|nr:hypothetical protein NCAS_0B02970 [Naumovozyma castellii CBS 4309]CCC68381.1 hypothetical protein NCAS_0B02970 [Naumovozyma castellii CBS 4309]
MSEVLDESVECFQDMISQLQGSVDTLKSNSEENNYLTETMLQSRRVFELVPEYDVQRAKLSLIEEVDPVVKTLEEKLRKSLSKMQRELETLQQSCELNELRLNNTHTTGQEGDVDMSSDNLVVMASSTNEELETLKQLKTTKRELELKLAHLQH